MIGSMKIMGLDSDLTSLVSMKIAESNQYNKNEELFGKNTKPVFGCGNIFIYFFKFLENLLIWLGIAKNVKLIFILWMVKD